MNRWCLSVCAVMMITPLSADAGIIFSQRSDFESAVGSFLEEDFDGISVNSSGFAAIQNGQSFQGFSLQSLSIGGSISLLNNSLSDTGLDGAFLVDDNGSGNNRIRPGGQGAAGTTRDNDDFRILFDQPVFAAGLDILDNRRDSVEQPERIRFFDLFGNLLRSQFLPGGTSGSGSSGFIGLVQNPGENLIASIQIDEGNTLDDDILFDNVVFATAAVPEPSSIILMATAMIGICIQRRSRSPYVR